MKGAYLLFSQAIFFVILLLLLPTSPLILIYFLVALAVILASAYFSMKKARKYASSDDLRLLAVAEDIAKKMRCKLPRICKSDSGSPAQVGIFKTSSIVIPRAYIEEALASELLDFCLAHELSHYKHKHEVIRLLTMGILWPFFFIFLLAGLHRKLNYWLHLLLDYEADADAARIVGRDKALKALRCGADERRIKMIERLSWATGKS